MIDSKKKMERSTKSPIPSQFQIKHEKNKRKNNVKTNLWLPTENVHFESKTM
jgi:hypothetical protein